LSPEELYRSVLDAGGRAPSEAREPVVALGLANQGETELAWDPATGRPLTDALVCRTAEPRPSAPNSPRTPTSYGS